MRGKIKQQGNYELFETTSGNQILSLNQKDWYALIAGKQGDIIVHSNSDHEKKNTLQQGTFYLVHFQDDPEFNDIPQLLLQHGNKYTQFILPNGLPSKKDHQKKLVRSEEEISAALVKEHVEGEGNSGSEKQYSDKEEGLRNKTKDALLELAREQQLDGRSSMRKEELVKQLSKK